MNYKYELGQYVQTENANYKAIPVKIVARITTKKGCVIYYIVFSKSNETISSGSLDILNYDKCEIIFNFPYDDI